MEFKTLKVLEKPNQAPSEFTIYVVDGDEFIFCPIRKKTFKVTNKPEEKVRQWWIYRLNELYQYSFDQISVEVSVKVGSTEAKKKADIVVYKDQKKILQEYSLKSKKQTDLTVLSN